MPAFVVVVALPICVCACVCLYPFLLLLSLSMLLLPCKPMLLLCIRLIFYTGELIFVSHLSPELSLKIHRRRIIEILYALSLLLPPIPNDFARFFLSSCLCFSICWCSPPCNDTDRGAQTTWRVQLFPCIPRSRQWMGTILLLRVFFVFVSDNEVSFLFLFCIFYLIVFVPAPRMTCWFVNIRHFKSWWAELMSTLEEQTSRSVLCSL